MKKQFFSSSLIFFLVLLVVQPTLASSLKKYLSFYGTYLNYGNSEIKENGYAFTAYSSIGDGKQGFEAAISQLHINYESGYEDLDQTDFTLAYINTGNVHPNLSLRLGGHYISTDDNLTDNGKIVFGDLTYFVPYRWNMGIEMAYSNYDWGVDVIQISPHIAYFLNLKKHSVYLEARGYYINLDENKKLGISLENYYSLELSATNTHGPISIKLSGWVGQQIFAVKSGGFVVYNLTEKYRGGASGEATYRWKRYVLGFTGSWNTYKEVQSGKSVNQIVFTTFFGFNF